MYLGSMMFSKAIMNFLLPAILRVSCSVLDFTFKRATVVTTKIATMDHMNMVDFNSSFPKF